MLKNKGLVLAMGLAAMAAGSAAGSLVPPISGALLDRYGVAGVFGLAAAMYVVFAICIQFGPETYGKSMEDVNQPAEAGLEAAAMPVAKPA